MRGAPEKPLPYPHRQNTSDNTTAVFESFVLYDHVYSCLFTMCTASKDVKPQGRRLDGWVAWGETAERTTYSNEKNVDVP